jgi:hypothetical protein
MSPSRSAGTSLKDAVIQLRKSGTKTDLVLWPAP